MILIGDTEIKLNEVIGVSPPIELPNHISLKVDYLNSYVLCNFFFEGQKEKKLAEGLAKNAFRLIYKAIKGSIYKLGALMPLLILKLMAANFF